MRQSEHTIQENSFTELKRLVETRRQENLKFGTFPLDDDSNVTIQFDNRESLTFSNGTIVSFYGARALLLATLRDGNFSLTIGNNLTAKLLSHNEPSSEELYDKATFIKWMSESWSINE